jgi:hypothetical protein
MIGFIQTMMKTHKSNPTPAAAATFAPLNFEIRHGITVPSPSVPIASWMSGMIFHGSLSGFALR